MDKRRQKWRVQASALTLAAALAAGSTLSSPLYADGLAEWGQAVDVAMQKKDAAPALGSLAQIAAQLEREHKKDALARLETDVLANEQLIAGLNLGQLEVLKEVSLAVDQRPADFGKVVHRWTERNPTWKTFSANDLARLMALLGPTGTSDVEARKDEVANQAWKQHLSKAGFTDSADAATLDRLERHFIAHLDRELQDDYRARAANTRWARTFADPKWIANQNLSELLTALRRDEGYVSVETKKTFWDAWVAKSDNARLVAELKQIDWKTLEEHQWVVDAADGTPAAKGRIAGAWFKSRSDEQLAKLRHEQTLELMKWLTPGSSPSESSTAAAVFDLHLGLIFNHDPANFRDRSDAISHLGENASVLTKDQKSVLIAQADKQLFSNEDWLKRLRIKEAARLIQAQQQLGISGEAVAASAANWIKATDAERQIRLADDVPSISTVVAAMSGDAKEDSEVEQERKVLVEELYKLAAEPEIDIPYIATVHAIRLTAALASNLEPVEQQQFGNLVTKYMTAKPMHPAGLPHDDLSRGTRVLVAMGQQDRAATILGQYVDAFSGESLTLHQDVFLPLLYLTLSGTELSSAQRELRSKAAPIFGKHLTEIESESGDPLLKVRTYVAAGQRDRGVRLVHELYQRQIESNTSLESLSSDDLFSLGSCILALDPNKEGQFFPGYPRFADALVANLGDLMEYEKKDQQWNAYMIFVGPVADEAGQQLIESQLNHPGLIERIVAHKLVATINKMKGSLKVWQGTLDNQLASSDLKGDQLAEKLLARSYAKELESWDRAALSGSDYLDEAIAAAETDTMRIHLIDDFVERYGQATEFERGKSFLQSVRYMVGEEERPKLAELEEFLYEHEDAHREHVRVELVKRQRRTNEGQLDIVRGAADAKQQHRRLDADSSTAIQRSARSKQNALLPSP